MKLLRSYLDIVVAIVQIGHAFPQANADKKAIVKKDGVTIGHIVVLKKGLSEDHLNNHLYAVKGIQRRSKRDGDGEIGVKHVINGANYGFQGYTGVFTPETLEYIKAHQHVDYVEKDSLITEPPVEIREVSDTDLDPLNEYNDPSTAGKVKVSTGAATVQKSTIDGSLSWGQGYGTLMEKGLRLDVVLPLSAVARGIPPVLFNETNPATAYNFTAPSGDMTGVDADKYFTEPNPESIFHDLLNALEATGEGAKAIASRAETEISGCTGKIKAHYKFAENYDAYMDALEVSASLAISGWGQSAAVSGSYLDQAKMNNDALTFVAIIEIAKQQTFENGRFNAYGYTKAQFHQTHGDRWVRGYSTGGRLMARLTFTAKDKSRLSEIKSDAEASLRGWGVSGDITASAKKSIDNLDKNAFVDIAMFQEGNLGVFMMGARSAASSDQSSIGSAAGSFKQVKEWADEFIQQACNHNYAYRPVLEEYTILPDFPADQAVNDYGTARRTSNLVLKELVKLSELTTLIKRQLEGLANFESDLDEMEFDFLEVVDASKQWVEKAAKEPITALQLAKDLMRRFRTFNRTYKRLLNLGQGRKAIKPAPIKPVDPDAGRTDCWIMYGKRRCPI